MSYYDSKAREAMAGKVIASVALDDAREHLTIAFADGSKAVAVTEGDCCSTTWIDDLTVPVDIVGATLTDVVDSDAVSDDTPSQHPPEYTDEVKVYNTAIRTDRGEIIVDYRNSSNGYYGGSIEWEFVEAK